MREPLRGALRALGLQLRDEWLAACDAHLRGAHANFDGLPLDRQARAVPPPRAVAALRPMRGADGARGALRRADAPARCVCSRTG
jgi:hypothetical protein